MFQELIFTRCRYGLKGIINKADRCAIASEGYKFYSCTPSVYADGVSHESLQFLSAEAGAKNTFKDPAFMDEAYLYYVPEDGSSFFVNFKPIHFDRDEVTDYAHRGGNFINQTLVGDFTAFYPYELFGDNNVWDAKGRGEAYYYATEPTENAGKDIESPVGSYFPDQIRAFVAAGRQEALSKAVAFLIRQYSLKPEERKFLVIQDENMQNIEMWIAAIESAFSPRMAAGLPFATRMERFDFNNIYTVNELGKFQQQRNMQDPKQSKRCKAMIVGVCRQDNPAPVRVMPTSPFVLLDGTAKKAMFEEDIAAPYYSFITRLDDEQTYFCREFLQTFGIDRPASDIIGLYDAYRALERPNTINAGKMVEILGLIGRYPVFRTPVFDSIYKAANSRAEGLLHSEPAGAIAIMDWIIKNSATAEDAEAPLRLQKTVSGTFAETLFTKQKQADVAAMWKAIRSSGFAAETARLLTNGKVLNHYADAVRTFSPGEAWTMFAVYMDCGRMTGAADPAVIKYVTSCCAVVFARGKAQNMLAKMMQSLSGEPGMDVFSLLLDVAKSADRNTSDFIVNYLVQTDRTIIASERSMTGFCRALYDAGMASVVPSVLCRYAGSLAGLPEMERFAHAVPGYAFLDAKDRASVYAEIDRRLPMNQRGTVMLASYLQQQARNEHAVLPVSAHICALEAVCDKRRSGDIRSILTQYAAQGFPGAVGNGDYVPQLCAALAKERWNTAEEQYICGLLLKAPSAYMTEYLCRVLGLADKQTDRWCFIIGFLDNIQDRNLRDNAYNDLIKAIKTVGLSQRAAGRLEASLDGLSRQFFAGAVEDALGGRRADSKRGGGFMDLFRGKK